MDTTTSFDGWDLDEGPARTSPRRGPWLLIVGAIPWLIIAVFLLRPGPSVPLEARPAVTSPQVSEAVTPSSVDTASETVAAAAPSSESVPTAVLTAPTGAVPSVAEAGAVASVVARAHLTGVGPVLAVAGARPPPDRYVEHLSIESVVHPGPGAAVATVLAVLLTIEDDAYAGVEVLRLAVPLTFDGAGASPAGAPWRLPPPDLTDRPVTTGEAIDDPVLLTEAGAAVTAAGFSVEAVTGLVATTSWPLVATVQATAPGESTPRLHRIWLRSHLGELVVAGADLSRQEHP